MLSELPNPHFEHHPNPSRNSESPNWQVNVMGRRISARRMWHAKPDPKSKSGTWCGAASYYTRLQLQHQTPASIKASYPTPSSTPVLTTLSNLCLRVFAKPMLISSDLVDSSEPVLALRFHCPMSSSDNKQVCDGHWPLSKIVTWVKDFVPAN